MSVVNLHSDGHCCVCAAVCHHVGPMRFCQEHKPSSAPPSYPGVIPLPNPLLRPCPSTVEAELGFHRPTTIPCGLEVGHYPRTKHRFLIEWSGGIPPGAPNQGGDR